MGDPAYRQQVPLSAGVFLAAPTWNRFMQGALDRIGRGDEWFTPPPGVRSETVDGRPAWFLDGTGPDTPAPPLPPSVHSG